MIYRRRNPFVVGNSVGGTEAFVGREDIIAKVEATLLQPLEPGIVLFGQRRIGKTSILQELRARLARSGPWTPIFFDLQGRTQATVDDIIRDLAQAIALARRLPEPKFQRNVTGEFRAEWLPHALETLEEHDRIVLLFDEFDVVADPKARLSNRRLFEFLRSMFDGEFRQHVAAVFAMGRTMEDLDISAGPLFRGIRTEHISTLQRPDFEKLLLQGEQGGALEWTAEAREAIWALTAGHPMLTQLLASSIWQATSQAACKVIERKQVSAVVSAVLMESRNILGWLWDGLTPACRVVASSLAEHGTSPVSMDELEQILRQSGVRIMMGQLTEAPARLRDWDLLEAEAGDPRKFRFKVELLRQWITQHRPFASVREYLDRLNPEADDYYNRALDRWNSNKSPEDIVSVIRLLELVLNDPKGNPNHVGATELLAEVYLAQERLEDAIQVVARLLPSQTAALRPRYIYLLLLQVESLKGEETEEQRLQILDRILELAPGTAEAISAIHLIWRDRGRRAMDAGRLVEALDCFRRSDSEALLAEVGAELDRVRGVELLAKIERLEATEQWQEALELVETHRDTLLRVLDIEADTLQARLHQAQLKDRLYRRACDAADRGEKADAIEGFRQLIALDPAYRNICVRISELVGPSTAVPATGSGAVSVPWQANALRSKALAASGWLAALGLAVLYMTGMSNPAEVGEQGLLSLGKGQPDRASMVASESHPEVERISKSDLEPTGESGVGEVPWRDIDEKPDYPATDGGVTGSTKDLPPVVESKTADVVARRIPLKSAAAGMARQVRAICKLGVEDSSGEISVRFDVSPSTGLVTGLSIESTRGRLEDPQCITNNMVKLIRRLNASAAPQKVSISHTYELVNR